MAVEVVIEIDEPPTPAVEGPAAEDDAADVGL